MHRSLRLSLLAAFCGLAALGRLPGCTGILGDQKRIDVPAKAGPAEAFPETIVTPHLEQAIEPGRNVVWCSTFQLSWNELCTLIGEDIHLADQPPMVAVLNRKAATKEDLDEVSYVAMAGWVKDDIVGQIRSAMEAKFPARPPAMLPGPMSLREQYIIAYAFLRKNLEFPVPFEALDEPLLFAGTQVESFGTSTGKTGQEQMYAQVSILDYTDAEDFIIQLRTKTADDQVILARIEPASTLQETIDRVLTRIATGQPEEMVHGDVLTVPRLNFEILRAYHEIAGRALLTSNPEVPDDAIITSALQSILFEMNEEGVKLESEAVITVGCAASPERLPVHVMVFDRPFLILMKRAQATRPYFALWVDNAELMVSR